MSDTGTDLKSASFHSPAGRGTTLRCHRSRCESLCNCPSPPSGSTSARWDAQTRTLPARGFPPRTVYAQSLAFPPSSTVWQEFNRVIRTTQGNMSPTLFYKLMGQTKKGKYLHTWFQRIPGWWHSELSLCLGCCSIQQSHPDASLGRTDETRRSRRSLCLHLHVEPSATVRSNGKLKRNEPCLCIWSYMYRETLATLPM